MSNFEGFTQIYTGNGKGKTTAALGLCLRGIGSKMKIYIAQFMKSGNYSEIKAFRIFSNYVKIEQFGSGKFIDKNNISETDALKAQNGIKSAAENSSSGRYGIVVLDEINVAINCNLVNISDVKNIIISKSKSTELILTGRGAHPSLIELADLVTEMKEIKHYYLKGVHARIGIEK